MREFPGPRSVTKQLPKIPKIWVSLLILNSILLPINLAYLNFIAVGLSVVSIIGALLVLSYWRESRQLVRERNADAVLDWIPSRLGSDPDEMPDYARVERTMREEKLDFDAALAATQSAMKREREEAEREEATQKVKGAKREALNQALYDFHANPSQTFDEIRLNLIKFYTHLMPNVSHVDKAMVTKWARDTARDILIPGCIPGWVSGYKHEYSHAGAPLVSRGAIDEVIHENGNHCPRPQACVIAHECHECGANTDVPCPTGLVWSHESPWSD